MDFDDLVTHREPLRNGLRKRDGAPGLHFCAGAVMLTYLMRLMQPEIRPWMDGRIRCHYPLGDPDRDARIAADGPAGAKAVP